MNNQLTPFERATEYYKTSQNPRIETRIFLTSILGLQEQSVDAAISEIEDSLGVKPTNWLSTATEVAQAEVIPDPMPLFPTIAKQYPNWVTYKDSTQPGKAPRISGTTDLAKSNDPKTWVDYKTLCLNIQNGKGFKNPGFVTNGAQSGYLTGLDLDGGKTTNGLQPWLLKVLEIIPKTYVEWTPNGGLRAWVRGDFKKHGRRTKYKMAAEPGWNGKAQAVEVFDDGLYFTTTGNRMSDTSEVAVLDDAQTLALLDALAKLSTEDPMVVAKKKTSGEFDPAFKNLFDRVGWKPLEDRMHKMSDPRFHDIHLEEGRLTYCPMPGHTPRSVDLVYSRLFGIIPGTDVLHCFGCNWSGDMVKAVRDFDAGEDGGQIVHATMTDAARVICEQNGLNPDEMFPSYDLKLDQKPDVQPVLMIEDELGSNHTLTAEEYEAEMDKEFPVIPLRLAPGPTWDDDIMYGIAGDIIRKASNYCEAHPAGMYLDLLASFGSIVGRGPYFNVSSTEHHANEFIVRVGNSSFSRKGTGRDMVNEVLKMVDPNWYQNRVMFGFGSAESIVNELRDDTVQSVRNKKNKTFEDVHIPGVTDKRLMIREPELASLFRLANKPQSQADVVIRNGWDGHPLRNLVKGKTDGLSNSNSCQYPHLSISADSTRTELLAELPNGAESNGFGNRFLYCYVRRVKKCPNGGPSINWTDELIRLNKVLTFARDLQYVGLQKSASKVWNRMYQEIDNDVERMPGLAGAMCARAVAHVRRLALIFCLLDGQDTVESYHLHAAKRIWDYCQDSARYIFSGTTADQERILQWVAKTGPVTVPQITQQLFQKHRKADWVRLQITGLIQSGKVIQQGDLISVKL